ncbi:MAG TPA: hypothetical protein VNR00_01335 [Opitutus sp.]|nr:hypothetical protein [Opitutus sp.]
MEPADLNASPSRDPEDARLEQFLRQPLAPLPDDGFTARVLATLPPPPSRTRAGVCLAAASVGVSLALVRIAAHGGWAAFPDAIDDRWTALQSAWAASLAPLPPGDLAIAAVVTAVSLGYAFRGRLRQRWTACFG